MRTGHDNHDIPTVADLIISHLSLSLISNYSPLTLTKIECPLEKKLHFKMLTKPKASENDIQVSQSRSHLDE